MWNKVAFFLLCIPLRFLLAYLVSKELFSSSSSVFILAIGLGFGIIYMFGLRKTGLETLGKPIWWNNLRPVHSILFLMSGILLLIGQSDIASKLLYLDVFIGIIAQVNRIIT